MMAKINKTEGYKGNSRREKITIPKKKKKHRIGSSIITVAKFWIPVQILHIEAKKKLTWMKINDV